MRNTWINLFIIILLLINALHVLSQDAMFSGQFRPRYEYRHGYKTLMPDDQKAANFVSQRTRLNFKYSDVWFKFGLSLQNVGVWGETGTLSTSDVNGIASCRERV